MAFPRTQQDELQRSLATLRDDVPPVPFADLEKLMRREFGGPLQRVFSDFDERAFAAASIGQVHRATTVDGDDVAVKIQYPGVAEAVETDLRNAMLLLPLVKRLAPGLDAKAIAAELRERIGEELDYELEAQNQRRIGRLMRGHPFVRVPGSTRTSRPGVCWCPSTLKVSASRPCGGPPRRSATATARSSSACTSACSIATGSPSEILTPVTTCCAPTAASASWTSACCATSTPSAWPMNGRSPSPSAKGRGSLKAALLAGGYLPANRADAVDADFALRLMRMAIKWYAVPGERRFSPDQRSRSRWRRPRALRAASSERR